MTDNLPVPIADLWAQQSAAAIADEPVASGLWLSIKGGILTMDDEEMPGNQVCVVVIDSLKENTFYIDKYDPNSVVPPVCYAFGRGADEMFPHESMQADPYFRPQHVVDGIVAGCEGCPQNEYGSADTGKGKACANRRRLTLLPAGIYTPRRGSRDFDLELFNDAKHYAMADAANLKLPVTSVKNWAKYVTQLGATVRRPPHGVITRIWAEPDPKTQVQVRFEMLDLIPDEMAQIIMDRHDAAASVAPTGYLAPDDSPASLRR